MYRFRLLSLSLLAATSFVASSLVFGENDSTTEATQLRDLMAQRRDVLEERLSEVEQSFNSGTEPFERVLEAQQDLLEAKLALADTETERIAVLKSRVDNAEELEQFMKSRFASGTASRSEYLHAKAERIFAQIDLLRAR